MADRGGPLNDLFERGLLLGLGAASMTRDRVQELVDELVRRGRLTQQEGSSMMDDLASGAAAGAGSARQRLGANLQELLRQWGLVTRSEWDEMQLKVAQLEHRLALLEEKGGQA